MMQAVLSASSALAGLVLVFLGLIVNTLRSYQSDTPGAVTRGYRILASVIAAAFISGITSVSLCVWWLAGDQDAYLRGPAVGAFVAQLVLLIVSAVSVLAVFVWKEP